MFDRELSIVWGLRSRNLTLIQLVTNYIVHTPQDFDWSKRVDYVLNDWLEYLLTKMSADNIVELSKENYHHMNNFIYRKQAIRLK